MCCFYRNRKMHLRETKNDDCGLFFLIFKYTYILLLSHFTVQHLDGYKNIRPKNKSPSYII